MPLGCPLPLAGPGDMAGGGTLGNFAGRPPRRTSVLPCLPHLPGSLLHLMQETAGLTKQSVSL